MSGKELKASERGKPASGDPCLHSAVNRVMHRKCFAELVMLHLSHAEEEELGIAHPLGSASEPPSKTI
jgi:hypothetical protein